MSGRKGWGAPVVMAFAALAFAAGDATKYDIETREKWTAGQVVTVTMRETSDTDTKMGGNSLQAEQEALEATYVSRCDEIDADGSPKQRTIWIQSWKQTKGGSADVSISGALLTAGGGAWHLSPGKTPSAAATKWLESKFGKKTDTDAFHKIFPSKMAVGEVVKPDPKVAAEAFGAALDEAPIDISGVTMEIKLLAVRGTPPDAVGDFEVKFHMPIAAKVPGLPPGAKVAPDSGVDAVGKHTGPLTNRTMLGTERFDMDMKMNVDMEMQGQKVAIVTTGKMVQESSTVAGGTIPEAPKPATPAPAPGGK